MQLIKGENAMIELNSISWQDKAMEKTTAERKSVTGQRESLMANAVLDMIHEFCIQSEVFAKAVAEGGSFADCMKAVAKGVGNSISDIDAYKKAVAFYMPGAEIEVQMKITTVPGQQEKVAASAEPLLLRLEDLIEV